MGTNWRPVLALLAGLAAGVGTGCQRRPPEAAPPVVATAASRPAMERESAAPAGAAQRLGRMIERFAAAETLSLLVTHLGRDRQVLWEEFKLLRPDGYHVTRQALLRQIREISDGKTRWVVDRGQREYEQSQVAEGERPALGLLPGLFLRAEAIAAEDGAWAAIVAGAKLIEETAIDGTPCAAIEVAFGEPAEHATLWLAEADGLPLHVREVTAAGTREYRVSALELDARLSDAIFVFAPGPEWRRKD